MSPGLRERKRRAVIQRIQESALDLFGERGFDPVTIEEIAQAADVSASTVYRYFGTKEGLIVSDDFDALSQGAVDGLLDVTDPVDAVRRIVAGYETTAAAGTDPATSMQRSPWRRVHYFFDEPSVRLAVYASLDRASSRIAASLVSRGGMSATRAHVAAHALVFGYFAALEQWHQDGGVHPIADYVDDGMSVLSNILAKPGIEDVP